MKKLSFAISLTGIFILLILLNFSSPIQVNNLIELSKLPPNTKVQTSGKVLSEKQYLSTKLIRLNNSLEIICRHCHLYPSYINRTIVVVGTLEKYQNLSQILALRLKDT